MAVISIIGGPTASGKSAKALELAQARGGAVINCDSMQIYDGLPLLTAQPSAADREAAPHYLYGALHPNEMCSAGRWQRMAVPLIQQLLDEGIAPIICGGTGLYIKALTEGLSPIPDIPLEVKQRGDALMAEMGVPAFHAMLEARDPLIAGRFHENHSARLLRAWEVLEHTGRSLASWQQEPRQGAPDGWEFEFEFVMPDRAVLYDRCNRRFEMMLEQGAVQEAEDFAAQIEAGHVDGHCLLTKALGYKALLSYARGDIDLDTAKAQAQQETRRYAKRQMTWFRNQF